MTFPKNVIKICLSHFFIAATTKYEQHDLLERMRLYILSLLVHTSTDRESKPRGTGNGVIMSVSDPVVTLVITYIQC